MIKVKSETELEMEQEEISVPKEIPATSSVAHLKKVEERYSDPEVKEFYEKYNEQVKEQNSPPVPGKKFSSNIL
jgi:regulatory protein YycI of two-component signal transduction system YycFG